MTTSTATTKAAAEQAAPEKKASSKKAATATKAATKKKASSKTPTSTSSFGVSGRVSHDASDFYRRFDAASEDRSGQLTRPAALDQLYLADARQMHQVRSNSVGLVITSPPYFAGKAYELEPGSDGTPSSFGEYLDLLREVFAECARVLEPGGRLCVNVANLGRRPYRSLSTDVLRILEVELGLLPRGEIIWLKAEGAGGSCAWGSYRSAANPVLRDLSERIIVVSKDRFDRCLSPKQREAAGLPHANSISKENFMAATLDVWKIPPESATRVGHPAPFPVELPRRLIELYSYVGDLVLDPFMGAGSTALAAARTGRHFLGFDTEERYVELARNHLAADAMQTRQLPEEAPELPESAAASTRS